MLPASSRNGQPRVEMHDGTDRLTVRKWRWQWRWWRDWWITPRSGVSPFVSAGQQVCAGAIQFSVEIKWQSARLPRRAMWNIGANRSRHVTSRPRAHALYRGRLTDDNENVICPRRLWRWIKRTDCINVELRGADSDNRTHASSAGLVTRLIGALSVHQVQWLVRCVCTLVSWQQLSNTVILA